MDPLKFSIQLKDEVSQGLDAIKRKLDSLKTQDIKVRLSVENKQEIEQMLKGLGSAFGGFNMQLPDFGKVIAGATEAKAVIKETASEMEAVKKAEDALAAATAKRAREQTKLNTLLAADSNSAVADKVKAYTALPEEVRKRIMEINRLLASPMGQFSQTVITSMEGRMGGVRKQLDDIFGIPQSEINAFRADFSLRLRQLVQARREEIEKAKREVDDPSFQTQVINGIRMRYVGMLEGLYDKVPMGANGTPYTALRGLTQELQMLEGQYKNLTETRASLQAEFTSLLNQSTASATSQAAAEKAVTDATNAHAEAVKKLNTALAEQEQHKAVQRDWKTMVSEEKRIDEIFSKYTDKLNRNNYKVDSKFWDNFDHYPLMKHMLDFSRGVVDMFGPFDKQISAMSKSSEALGDIFGRIRDQVKDMFKTYDSDSFERMLKNAKEYRRFYNKDNYSSDDSEKYWRYVINLLEKALELKRQFEKDNPNFVMPTIKTVSMTQISEADKAVQALESEIVRLKEAEAKASADLAAAKENLAKAQAAETTGTKAIEAARQKVKESEEAEKKATDELTKAKEALAKVEKENAAVGKKKWSEVDSMNDLITRLKYMTQLTEKLKDKNLVNNTGKMTDYYKNLEALGTAFNRVLGDTPKVEQSSMLEYINKVRAAYQEFLAMVNSKQATGGAFAKSSVEKFDMIRNLWDAISKTGGDQGYLTSVQNQMNSIQSVIIDSIRNLIEQINRMKQTISDDNFTAYKTRIENAATAMNKLTEAFVKFQGVVGKDEGMKNFMTGLGEVINKIRYNLKSLGEGANNMSGDQMLKNYRRNLDKIEEGLYRLQEARGKIIEAISIGKGSGMDVSGMENFLTFLQKYENRLLKLRNDEAALATNDLGGVFGRNYKALLSNTSDFVKQANDYQAAATKVKLALIDIESAVKRMDAALSRSAGTDTSALSTLRTNLVDLQTKIGATSDMNLASKLLGDNFAQKIQEVNRAIASQDTAIDNMRKYQIMLDNIEQRMSRLASVESVNNKLNRSNTQVTDHIDKLDDLKRRISEMLSTDKSKLADGGIFSKIQFEYRRTSKEADNLAKSEERLNRQADSSGRRWEQSRQDAIKEADALSRLINKWEEISSAGKVKGFDTSELDARIAIMKDYLKTLQDMQKQGNFAKTTSEYVRQGQFIVDKRNADESASSISKAVKALEQGNSEAKKWADSQRDASAKLSQLIPKMERWKSLSEVGQRLGIDTSDLDKAIIKLQKWMQTLDDMSKGGKWNLTTREFLNQPQFAKDMAEITNAANPIIQQIAALRENEKAKRQAGIASKELTLQEQRLAAEMDKVAQSAKGQSQTLSDLKSMAQQYLSVYGAQQFINNIIEIGGQLENQRMSIASILGDAAQANTLFEQIQSLAVKSPFGVVELDQYTKQLSAFGFQYNELYDMTKRLADISAGAGTDVGRLALALGHVRAEGALTGYTLRQFAMNNIPMLQKLSDMLSAREGRLVSTQDIRKRVSNKQIGYEDVISVIKGLTNEGGMFYNMQEAISQSTKSKWKNLKDAMDIMYGKMAESDFVGGGLKDLATILTNLTKKWERIGAILITTGSAWGIAKMAAMAYNSAIGANAAQTLKAMKIAQRHDAATLSVAKSYRALTAAEQANLTSRRSAIITTTQLAISNKRLSAEELSRAVAIGKLTKQQAFCAIAQSNLTIGQKRMYAEMIKGTVILNAWQAGALRLRIAFEGLKASFLAFATNPMTWILTAVTALTYLWSKHNEQLERAKELQDSINTTGREGVKNVKDFVNSNTGANIVDEKTGTILTDNYEKYGNTRLQLPVFASLDQASVKSVMDNAEQFIKEYSATPNAMLNDAFAAHGDKVNNLRAQYDSLEKSLNTLHKAYAILNKDFREVMDFSMEETGGWFNDDLIENINDYSKAYSEYRNNIAKFANDHEDATNKALRAALGVKSFGDAVRAANEELKKSGSPALSNAQMLQMLLDNTKKYAEAEKVFRANVGFSGRWDWGNLTKDKANERNRWQDMENDLDTAISSMKTKLKALGWDFKNLTDAQKQALAIALAEMVGKATDSTDEVRDRIVALAKEKVGIQIDVEQAEAVAKLNEVKKQLEALCDKTWMIEVGITGDVAVDLPNVDKKYKKAIEDIKRYGEAMKNKGYITKEGENGPQILQDNKPRQIPLMFKPNANPNSNTPPYDAVDADLINNYNEAVQAKAEALKYYEAYGFTPPEDKKGGKNGNKAYKGEFEKRWDERIRIMKEAYDWYEKWRKEYGKDTALDKVNSRYADVFESWRTDKKLPWKDFDTKDVISYAKYVRQIKDDAFAMYEKQKNDKSKNNGQEALRVFRQAVSLLTDFDWDEIQRRSEEYAASMKQNISDMSERWSNFKTLLESTGNRELAGRLAGLTAQDVDGKYQAEQLKRQIEGIMPSIDFAKVLNMDSRAIQNYLSETLSPKPTGNESDTDYMQRLADYNAKIKGIVESLEEWKKLEKEVEKAGIEAYKSIIDKAVDYASQLAKIASKLEELKLDILNNPNLTKQEQYNAIDQATASANMEALRASSDYGRFFSGMMSSSTAEMKKMADTIKYRLDEAMKNGAISAADYAKQIAEVDNAMAEKRLNDPNKWYNKGLFGGTMDERLQKKIDAGNDMMIRGADEYQRAKAAGDSKGMKAAQEKIDDGKSMVQGAKNFNITMKIIEKVIKAVDDSIQGTVKGFGYLQEMLDSFGVESDTMSTIGDYLGAIGNMSSHVTSSFAAFQRGDFVTAGAEGIGAVTSLISGFNQAHDNRLERQIVKLREEVTRISNNTATIVALRERELGYDSGDVRRSFISDYAPGAKRYYTIAPGWFKEGFDSKAQKDMYEYYSRNAAGSGYMQEYENLKAERANYMEQLNKQEAKKKKSQSDIEETKKKIAELDEQIYYFSQDLAKELWGIDFKSWGQQLSDALATAFENGSNMAEAFDDTVTGILQGLPSKMLNIGFIEPMFSQLQTDLFGQKNEDGTYSGGVIDLNNMKSSAQKVTDYIADFFGANGKGQEALTLAQQMLDAFERGLNDAGLSIFNSNLDTLPNAMQGTTEETSNLLAGYVNALRQDVAVDRIMLTQFTTEYWNSYIQQVTSMQGSLSNIDRNISLIYGLMCENGALYSMIDEMNERLRKFSMGVEKVHIN